MRFEEYQTQAHKTAQYPSTFVPWTTKTNVVDFYSSKPEEAVSFNEFTLAYPIMGLLGEAGELANKGKKIIRDAGGVLSLERRNDLLDELGDVLWYVAEIATQLNADLGEIATKNIEKLFSRMERGKIQGEGDNR